MTRRATRPRGGVTLVELLVVLAILGVMAGVVGLAVPPIRRAPEGGAAARVARARQTAVASGRAVTVSVSMDGRPRTATAFPDGSVVADSGLDVDRLSGAINPKAPPGAIARAP
jgi:prepilin-type N-terminal cleavage/methylation domain-containing protein